MIDSGREFEDKSVLEVGCGRGTLLKHLMESGFRVSGVDPSTLAVKEAKGLGVDARVGTTDPLPFDDDSFGVVVFGFCLYLCDRKDLFKIAAEADRVLKDGGCIIILDFYHSEYSENDYHHWDGLKSYKMDYTRLFTWHPHITLMKHRIGSHQDFSRTDLNDDWVSISVLKKGV